MRPARLLHLEQGTARSNPEIYLMPQTTSVMGKMAPDNTIRLHESRLRVWANPVSMYAVYPSHWEQREYEISGDVCWATYSTCYT